MASAPASAMARACSSNAAWTSAGWTSPIMSTIPVGPSEAKTFALARAARREISTPARLIAAALSASPWRARARRLAPKVLVRITRLPAST